MTIPELAVRQMPGSAEFDISTSKQKYKIVVGHRGWAAHAVPAGAAGPQRGAAHAGLAHGAPHA